MTPDDTRSVASSSQASVFNVFSLSHYSASSSQASVFNVFSLSHYQANLAYYKPQNNHIEHQFLLF